MSKCIICGKEVNKTYGNSNLMGVYCRSCATENHYTNEQLIEYSQQKIADLEAKLAESEEQLKEELVEKKGLERALSACNRQNDEFAEMIKKLVSEKEELKQQLAEKNKEIETILKENEELVIKHNVYNWGDKIQKDKVYSLTGEALELLINRQNQKALERLEKVKDIINASVRDDHIIWDFDIKEHID